MVPMVAKVQGAAVAVEALTVLTQELAVTAAMVLFL
jgi:hypothetical protein